MFGNLFKRKSVPKNDGNSGPSDIEKQQYIKVYELELSNMEDTPVYALKHQLSVGSEIGNIIIADPSVSPRHATFILQQEVVSVIDHGSISGTMVNGQKIEPGKYIILEETDVVNVGDLEIKLRVGTETAPIEPIPEVPEEEEEVEDKKSSKKTIPSKSLQERKEKIAFNAKEHLQKNTKKKKPMGLTSVYSANSLVRVLAVLSDLLLSYSLLVIFLPFDEFKDFLEFIPTTIASLLEVEFTSLWAALMQDYAFVAEMIEDGYQFFSQTFQFVPLLLTFILLRLVTTLMMGVSISEFALGVRATGNGIWARIGGVIRVLIGVFTWPFIIFDIPSIISRRTLKEFITFTNITVPSKFMAILGVILYIPLLFALAGVSPLLQGLEPPEPIIVNDKVDQRVRVKVADPAAATSEGAEAPVETPKITDQSDSLNFEVTYDSKDLAIVPNFKFQGVKNKLALKTSLMFYQKDSQREVEFEVFKTFDFKQLLGIGMKNNVVLFDKYPQIYNFVYDSSNANPALKPGANPKAETAFANEFIQFTKVAFSLGAENALDIMQEETFLIKGLVDYKASFLGLIEYKDFDMIGFMKIGNLTFMKITFNKQKPFDLIIPLMRGEGKIFKVSYDKKENLGAISSKFYKFNLEKSNWMSKADPRISEVMSALEVYDLFSSENFKTKVLQPDKAQALYAYYFETSATIVKGADSVELDLWKSKIKNLVKLIDAIPTKVLQEGEEDPKAKLLQNFRDLSDALENNNLEYLGISQSTTV